MNELTEILLNYGVLGLMCLLLIGVIIRLYQDNQKKDQWIQQHAESTARIMGESSAVMDKVIDNGNEAEGAIKEAIVAEAAKTRTHTKLVVTELENHLNKNS